MYDGRSEPYGIHCNMPRILPTEIEYGDSVIVECKIIRKWLSETGTWDTALELMGVVLLCKHKESME